MRRQQIILIVDDDDPLRLSLSLILQKKKYRVETAANAEEALKYLHSHACDLMFLDLNMPGMSGIELLIEVYKQFPRLPVLILTAHAGMDSAIQALRLRARDYLVKPVEPVVILTRVAEVLAERQQPDHTKEIVDELQTLLFKLKGMDGGGMSPSDAPEDPARVLKKGGFELDLHDRHATLNGEYVPVHGVYFDYLVTLLHHAPKAVSCKTLVKESQDYDANMIEARETARWRIHELRQVVEPDPQHPQYILTVRGTGYRLAI